MRNFILCLVLFCSLAFYAQAADQIQIGGLLKSTATDELELPAFMEGCLFVNDAQKVESKAIIQGEIYYDSTTALNTTITTAGTYYPIVGQAGKLFIDHVSNNITANVTEGNASFTVTQAGTFKISYAVSYEANAINNYYQAAIFINGVRQPSIASKRLVKEADVITPTYNTGFVTLEVGDVIDLRFTSDSNGDIVEAYHVALLVECSGG